MIYDKNLELIKKSSSFLYKQIKEEISLFSVEIREFKSGNALVRYGEFESNLHSIYDQDYEMKLVLRELEGDEQVLLVFGIGNGYFIQYVKKMYPNIKRILVVEPSIQLFDHFLKNCDLYEVLNNISVSFLVNRRSEDISVEIGNFIGREKFKIVHLLAYRAIFSEYYSSLLKEVKNNILFRYGNVNFQRNAGKLVMLNFINNIDFGFYDDSVLEKLIKNQVVIVVAAGPSLNKNIHLIEKAKGKALIIAVGSAIPILDVKGIEPDFRMAFDPSEKEMKIVKNLVNDRIPMIYTNALYFDVLRNYNGPKIRIDLNFDSGTQYFDKVLSIQQKNKIVTAPSIAISAVDLAVKYGASKVVILGFDGAVYQNELYALGVDKYSENENLEEKGYFKVKDIFGEEVYTNKGFMMNKIQLESLIDTVKDVTFINATEGGILSEGVVIKNFSDVLAEDLSSSTYLEFNNSWFEYDLSLHQKRIETFLRQLHSDIIELESLIEVGIKSLKIINKVIQSADKVNRIEREMLYLRDKYNQIYQNDLFKSFILLNIRELIRSVETSNRTFSDNQYEHLSIEFKKMTEYYTIIQDNVNFLKQLSDEKIKILQVMS